ncbi:hypothetical protein BACDOR_01741 [Phocaeicola dorei DSM 17855]|uniref:Uncharacterized protein n=1 Tax=Phocaeicola dorei DSM 17855 TaxID=483217 RepID=B6VX48_9BACT|nr:hypothetical protein BACDOR_01741 [Phocaeicola dorei DSM 17855]
MVYLFVMGGKDSIFWETIHTFTSYLRFLPVSTIVHMGNYNE